MPITSPKSNSAVLESTSEQSDLISDDPAGFVCTETSEGNLELHFTTDCVPVAYLLVGSIKAIARILYDTTVRIHVSPSANDSRQFK